MLAPARSSLLFHIVLNPPIYYLQYLASLLLGSHDVSSKRRLLVAVVVGFEMTTAEEAVVG